MKKNIQIITLSNLVKGVIGVGLLTFVLLSAQSEDKKVTLCHIPPGNPSNNHLISISANAVDEHLHHGDKMMCYRIEEYNALFLLAEGNESMIVKVWELKDAGQDAGCK
ncbi:MAG: hypothetical protein V4622_11620 [Bacteroidota bacterium]